MKNKIIAVVPSAGLGKRFNPSIRKTFADLKDIPLLIHTLKRLCDEQLITEVIPVLREEDIDKGLLMVKNYGLDKVKRIAPGGKERQDSINNALKLLAGDNTASNSVILVHDGVRPFIPECLIASLVSGLKDFDGVIPGVPVKETLKEVSPDDIVISTVNREQLRSVQTPQAFTFKVLKNAYDAAFSEGFYATDDSALVERTGGRVKIVQGSPYNIKVTTPEDMEMVEWILGRRML